MLLLAVAACLQSPSWEELADKLRAATDREHYEAGAVDAAKALAELRSPAAMDLRLELFDARWASYRGVFLRDWFYAGMLRSTSLPEGERLVRAAADKRRSEALRLLCLQALENSAAPVPGDLLFDAGFLRAPANVRQAWQAAAGRALAAERAIFDQPADAARARAMLLDCGAPFLGFAALPDWSQEELDRIAQAALKAKDPPDRAEALWVLATRREQQAPFVAAAAAALQSGDRAPRAAALHAAAQFDAFECVPALVAFLERAEREGPGPWVVEGGDCLRRLTGLPFGANPALWRRWWAEAGPRWLEERRRGGARGPLAPPAVNAAGGTVSARFFGLPVDSARVAVLVDGSGSMSSSTLGELGTVEAAAREVKAFCEQLPDGALFQVWAIEREPVPLFKKAMPATRAHRQEAEEFLRGRSYRSTSAVVEALEAAMLDPAIDTLLLVGDGGSSAGLHAYDEHVLAAAVRLHRRHGVRIHTVLVTDNEAHADLMQALAAATGGRMVRPGASR